MATSISTMNNVGNVNNMQRVQQNAQASQNVANNTQVTNITPNGANNAPTAVCNTNDNKTPQQNYAGIGIYCNVIDPSKLPPVEKSNAKLYNRWCWWWFTLLSGWILYE